MKQTTFLGNQLDHIDLQVMQLQCYFQQVLQSWEELSQLKQYQWRTEGEDPFFWSHIGKVMHIKSFLISES